MTKKSKTGKALKVALTAMNKFQVFQGTKLVKNTPMFATYEQARTYVRKLIRKQGNYVASWTPHSNPALSDFGFSIKHI